MGERLLRTLPAVTDGPARDDGHTAAAAPTASVGAVPPVPGVTTIDHVGIAVPDFAAAVEFHRATFGLELTHEEVNEEQGVREGMLRAPGDVPGGPAVQLLAPLTPTSPIARFLDRRGPGLQQLAYRVVDVEAASAALRAAGLRLLYDAPRRGTAGSRVNFVHPADAGGVLVELVEPARGGTSS